jgi:hypothetical protein
VCDRTASCHVGCLVIWALRVAVEVGHAMRADGAAAVKSCRIMECVGGDSRLWRVCVLCAGPTLAMQAEWLTGGSRAGEK